jgi:hypothetical protein
MALLQTPSAHEFVYLDNAVVVIDGMTSVGESASAQSQSVGNPQVLNRSRAVNP